MVTVRTPSRKSAVMRSAFTVAGSANACRTRRARARRGGTARTARALRAACPAASAGRRRNRMSMSARVRPGSSAVTTKRRPSRTGRPAASIRPVRRDNRSMRCWMREQIAQRIPARERHGENRSMAGRVAAIRGTVWYDLASVLLTESYDPNSWPPLQATRSRRACSSRSINDLFRVLELQHVTPGNLRGFVRVKFRNIRSGTLADRSCGRKTSVERATLDEREMQYLYSDGDDYYFMDTSPTSRSTSRARRWASR